MMRRTHLAEFASGAYVFPGGAVDDADRDPALAALARGTDDAQASRALGMPEGGLAYWIAAIRECCEEAGLLLAYDGSGDIVAIEGDSHRAEFTRQRRALAQGDLALVDLLREGNLTLATDKLAYLSRWITQPGRPRRFDTRFFVARAPLRQQSEHDGTELLHHVWLDPRGSACPQRARRVAPAVPDHQDTANAGAVQDGRRSAGVRACRSRDAGDDAARGDEPLGARHALLGRLRLRRSRQAGSRWDRRGELRDRSGPARQAVAARTADHCTQSRHDDRTGNEHVPAGRCDNRHRGHRPRPGHRQPCRRDRCRGRRSDPVDLLHAHSHRPLAGGRAAPGAHRRDDVRHAARCTPSARTRRFSRTRA